MYKVQTVKFIATRIFPNLDFWTKQNEMKQAIVVSPAPQMCQKHKIKLMRNSGLLKFKCNVIPLNRKARKIFHYSNDVFRQGFLPPKQPRVQYTSNLVMMPIYRSWPVFQDGGRTRSTHCRYSAVLWKNFQPVSVLIAVRTLLAKNQRFLLKLC